MNYGIFFKTLGMLIAFMGGCMSVPLFVAWAYQEGDGDVFALSMAITLLSGVALAWGFRRSEGLFRRREAFAIVSVGWLIIGAFASLPYIFDQTFPTWVDAYFETMSGFTTTGASVMTDIEAETKAILFWRALTHWFGGIGIIVLFVAILPILGVGGRELFFTEAPGPIAEGIKPKITQTARTLVAIYCALVAVLTVILRICGMDWFDAACHSMATMATGGFGTKNLSVAHYDSVAIDVVLSLFMIIAAVNFSLYYMLILGHWKAVWRDTEMRWFLGIMAGGTLIVGANLYLEEVYPSFPQALRYALFQVATVGSCTGFATADFDRWPALSHVMLLLIMYIGGSAGSTSGGLKVIRLVVILKKVLAEVLRSFRPNRVFVQRLGKRVISNDVLMEILTFFVVHTGVLVASTVIVSAFNDMNLITAGTASLSSISGCGPGLSKVGPMVNYAWMDPGAKLVLVLVMLMGRLEHYAVLVLFLPTFWSRRG